MNTYSYLFQQGEMVHGRRIWDKTYWKGLTLISGKGAYVEISYHGRPLRLRPLFQPSTQMENDLMISYERIYYYHPDCPEYCCLTDLAVKTRYFMQALLLITFLSLTGIHHILSIVSAILP